jgi:uncharacterized protein (DUF362 family)
MRDNGITRRQFVKSASAAASGLLVGGCMPHPSGLVSLVDSAALLDPPDDIPADAVLLGLYSPATASDPRAAVRSVCGRLDWSWLSSGDSVFVKLACNSGNVHPAVTSPNAVRSVVAELFDRGAGRVIVGDQGGVGHVRTSAYGSRSGSTRQLTGSNGLHQAIVGSGAEPYYFDDQGWENGFFQANMTLAGHHWARAPYLAKVITEVDHIIYLPRLGSHSLAGYTHGHKIAVGWLRTDSRYAMHLGVAVIHSRFTELNYLPPLRDRLRLTLTLAEKALLDVGPDDGTIAELDAWTIIASSHLANHDLVGVATLAHVDRAMPDSARLGRAPKGYQKGLSSDPALLRAYEILGSVPSSIPVRLLGQEPSTGFRASLESHDGGILNIGQG